MSIPTSKNLTLAFGNDWSGDASITFTGLESDIDAGLATTELATTGGDVGSTASVSLSAMVSQPGYGYSPSNQHFDQYIAASGATWTADNTAAEGLSFAGQRGYLATIPSDKIDNFVSIRIQGAENVWFGAESVDTPSSSPAHLAVGGGPAGRTTHVLLHELPRHLRLQQQFRSVFELGPCRTEQLGRHRRQPYSGEYVAVTNWQGIPGSGTTSRRTRQAPPVTS